MRCMSIRTVGIESRDNSSKKKKLDPPKMEKRMQMSLTPSSNKQFLTELTVQLPYNDSQYLGHLSHRKKLCSCKKLNINITALFITK